MSSESSILSGSTSSLQELPPEVRLEIYRYALSFDTYVWMTYGFTKDGVCMRLEIPMAEHPFALRSTCRWIRKECHDSLYIEENEIIHDIPASRACPMSLISDSEQEELSRALEQSMTAVKRQCSVHLCLGRDAAVYEQVVLALEALEVPIVRLRERQIRVRVSFKLHFAEHNVELDFYITDKDHTLAAIDKCCISTTADDKVWVADLRSEIAGWFLW